MTLSKLGADDLLRVLASMSEVMNDQTLVVLAPTMTSLPSGRAFEYARRAKVVSFTTSGDAYEPIIFHAYVLSLGEQLYQCSLTALPGSYSPYLGTFHQFCQSVRSINPRKH